MLYHKPLLLPIILPHRIKHINHFTICNCHSPMRDIRGDYIKHTGSQCAMSLANGHVQLAFQDKGDLLMRVTVLGQVAAGSISTRPRVMLLCRGRKPVSQSKGFGGLVFNRGIEYYFKFYFEFCMRDDSGVIYLMEEGLFFYVGILNGVC